MPAVCLRRAFSVASLPLHSLANVERTADAYTDLWPLAGHAHTCNMAARPYVQVNVPPAPAPRRANTYHMNDIPGLSADKALQFTPFTTSILPAVDRIPIPEVSRVRENGRVSTSSERKLAQTLSQQQDLQPVVRNKIAALLNSESGTQLYLTLVFRSPQAVYWPRPFVVTSSFLLLLPRSPRHPKSI